MASGKSAHRKGFIYLLWAEDTTFFKIGFSRDVRSRTMSIDACSPVQLWISAVARGTMADEFKMHRMLRRFRVRGEWFSFPEEVARRVLAAFGPQDFSYAK